MKLGVSSIEKTQSNQVSSPGIGKAVYKAPKIISLEPLEAMANVCNGSYTDPNTGASSPYKNSGDIFVVRTILDEMRT